MEMLSGGWGGAWCLGGDSIRTGGTRDINTESSLFRQLFKAKGQDEVT